MNPPDALRAALQAHVGTRATVVELGPEPGYPELVELYGGNPALPASAPVNKRAHAAIADAAGYQTAAVARRRGRNPEAARKARQGFLRNLQRYRDGTRKPNKATRTLLERIARREVRRRRRVGTMAAVLDAARAAGLTIMDGASFYVRISADERWRDNLPAVFLNPIENTYRAAAEGDWDEAAFHFFAGWARGYGIPSAIVLEVADDGGLVLGLGDHTGRGVFRYRGVA